VTGAVSTGIRFTDVRVATAGAAAAEVTAIGVAGGRLAMVPAGRAATIPAPANAPASATGMPPPCPAMLSATACSHNILDWSDMANSFLYVMPPRGRGRLVPLISIDIR
jgi:hypothetical protein